MRLRVWGLRFRDFFQLWGLGFNILGRWFRVSGMSCRVPRSRFYGLLFTISGYGFVFVYFSCFAFLGQCAEYRASCFVLRVSHFAFRASYFANRVFV